MKSIKSTYKDIRLIFEQSITAKHIAESIISFDAKTTAEDALKVMEEKDFDIIGVREDGQFSGYANKTDLKDGILKDYINFPQLEYVIDDTLSLIKVFQIMEDHNQIFVKAFGSIAGIITKGDMQKPPIRMWLFGLVTQVEMQLLRLIRGYFPLEKWEDGINSERLDKARKLYDEQRKKNIEIDLANCLQFCDKRDIFIEKIYEKDEIKKLHGEADLDSKEKAYAVLKKLENLRNNLAHIQDIIIDSENYRLVKNAETLLKELEEIKI